MRDRYSSNSSSGDGSKHGKGDSKRSNHDKIVIMMKVVMASELEAEGLKIPNSLKSHQIFAEHLRVATENKQKTLHFEHAMPHFSYVLRAEHFAL